MRILSVDFECIAMNSKVFDENAIVIKCEWHNKSRFASILLISSVWFCLGFFFTFFLVFYFVVHFHTDLVRLDINQFITASEKNERIAPTHVYADIPCRWCHRRCRLMHSSQNSPRIAQCNLCNCQCICMCARALVRSNCAPTKQQRTVEKKKLWSANDTQIANCMKLKQLNAMCAHEREKTFWSSSNEKGEEKMVAHAFFSSFLFCSIRCNNNVKKAHKSCNWLMLFCSIAQNHTSWG